MDKLTKKEILTKQEILTDYTEVWKRIEEQFPDLTEEQKLTVADFALSICHFCGGQLPCGATEKIYVITYYCGEFEGDDILVWGGTNLEQALKKLDTIRHIVRTTFECYSRFLGLPLDRDHQWELDHLFTDEQRKKEKIFRNFLTQCDPDWLLPYWDMWDKDTSQNVRLRVFDGIRFTRVVEEEEDA